MRTIVALADVADGGAAHLREALMTQQWWLAERGFQILQLSYDELFRHRTAGQAEAAILFFPHRHWNTALEGRIDALYGTTAYGREMHRYLTAAGAALEELAGPVRYLNDPAAVALTRNKLEVKQRWFAAGVPTPAAVPARTPEQLLAAIRQLGCVFVKAPCASMNKGITMLSPNRWTTNYVFRDGALAAPGPADPQFRGPDAWSFTDIEVGDRDFLAALLAVPGFVMEQGFAAAAVGDTRLELRVTVLGHRVLDTRIRSAAAGSATTDAEPAPSAPCLSADVIDMAHRAARHAAAALALRYAVLDIVLDERQQPWVVDAQAFPALGTEPQTFRRVLELLTDTEVAPPEPSHHLSAAGTSRPTTEGAVMQSLDEFFADLNAEIKATKCVENDFFRSFRSGDITVEDVKMFSDQYYLYIRTFPRILAGLCARVEEEGVRKELAKTIVSELGGEGGQIHFKLYEQAIAPYGITVAGLNEIEYMPEAVALVDGIKQLFLHDSVEAAVGGHYTIELSGLPMIKSLYEGFRALQGSTVESMEYFYLHLLIEREHVEWIHAAVERVASPSARDDIRRGALTIAMLLGDFWDALQRRLTFQPVAA